jgi:hypothetical protein
MKQRGGRYTFDLSPPAVNGVAPNAAAWWAGSYPPVQRIACEGSTPNPLNPGPHTPSTQPTPVASSNLHLNPQSGGGTSPGTVGVGNVDSMYYYAPTAGYDNKPSTWVDSVGAPVQLQIPFAARELNPSCITTGHPPPLTGALQKGGKRKQRGAGLWNTLKNSVKKATNAVGITQTNTTNTGLSSLGNVYNNVGALNARPNVVVNNVANNAALARLGNAYAVTNTNLPPTVNNVTLATRAVNNLNALSNYPNSNSSSVYSTNSNNYVSGFEDSVSGGKRRRKGKKSRKARKNRKY